MDDVIILYRQIRTGSKQDIPDMLGVDQDANVCIIEMKNNEVSEDILPQVLGYAMWAETNPDSIKAIWLESKNKPDDIQIDWDSIQVRVIVIAPSFKSNVLKMTSKIGYPVDLVQIQRFIFETDEFVLVETIEDSFSRKPGVTTTLQDWTWEYYYENHSKEATDQFKKTVEALDAFAKEKGWNLPYNLNKYYTGFKFTNKVVFDVCWSGISTWDLRIKIPEEIAANFIGEKWNYQRYDSQFKQAYFRTKSGKFEELREMDDFLVLAYKRISGFNK
ncbi:MAG: hypothetical protein BWX85_01260 [Chloroflexi bacterium ADurb.Bin120]|mgnify:FL=1|uniref:DUF5655 domain-containing protein n=1 Tax=Candidatus Brevifilum fermentans TaxID=1986204 RepID=A0A1Y6KAY2_9CHLR|nr:hypothetical protein [Brevefilum fermentans]MDI9566324.1 hypothetical protein [Chloroflexota bacterium]OQB83499.1 MAG: hypothetical protein BWX85_01260 [Chloroflexi bacterium ADurb.Bin120]SMX55170.1 conserved protein of unknown function [Brevefilum fermentans]HOM66989.1 hypothetical protein [Brevefilum fermentans]